MVILMLLFVGYVLSYSTVPVAGQCTASSGSCAFSISESEESLQVSLEEHDHRLETMHQNMCSALEKLEAAVNRSNVRGQEELRQDLKTLYHNKSVNLDSLSEKIPEKLECHTTQDQEKYLRVLNLSLTSMTVNTAERIQVVNESLSSALQTINRSLEEKLQVIQVKLESQTSTLQTVNRSLDEKFQVMQVQLSSLINDSAAAVLREFNQKFQTLNETLSSAIDKINEKLKASLDGVKERNQSVESQDHCRNTSIMCDCSDIKTNGHTTSGVYRIYVVDQGQRHNASVFCDMTTTNGPWTVFQRRKDGSVDFYRGWSDYASGFGNASGEFWLGNNFLHLLTSKRRYRLRIDLEDFEGGKRYAEYSTFTISSSADKYRLRIGTYSGTAGGDSLRNQDGQRFSTKDNENDADSYRNCAVVYRGASWYNMCQYANLNGLYLRGRYSGGSYNGWEGIYWQHWHGQWYSLKTTEMKISA